jgi:hypothetical protein
MTIHINRDAVAGLLLLAIGAFIAIYAYVHYPVGQISRMGPGMFPVMLGSALVLVALAIVGQATKRHSKTLEVNVRSAFTVLLGLAAFALMVDPFGIVPGLVALMLISSLAVTGRRPIPTLLFSIVVTAGIVLIFVYVMKLNLHLFRLPA